MLSSKLYLAVKDKSMGRVGGIYANTHQEEADLATLIAIKDNFKQKASNDGKIFLDCEKGTIHKEVIK